MGSETIIHSGYVSTGGKFGLVKTRKYLALNRELGGICVCRDENSVSNRKLMMLDDFESVLQNGTRFTIKFKSDASPPNSGRSFSFICKSADEAKDWVDAIESQLGISAEEELIDADDAIEQLDIVGNRASNRVSTQSAASSGSQKPDYVADLTYFEFLGGTVVSTRLVWISEKPPVKQPRNLGSAMFFAKRLSAKLGGGDGATTKRKSSKTGKTGKEESIKPAEQAETKSNGLTVTKLNPNKLELAKLVEKSIVDKSQGKNASKINKLQKDKEKHSSTANSSSGGLFSKKLFGGKKKHSAARQAVTAKDNKKGATKEDIKEKIARQARQYGGGEYMTGGSTVELGKEIQNSKLAKQLEDRKKAYEKKKQEEERAKAKKKPEPAKPKPTLASFLEENEKQKDTSSAEPEQAPASPNANKLQQFLETNSS